jgi:hypothetical protein
MAAADNPLGREYTEEEWAAARLLGYTNKHDGGPVIYATGDYYPNLVRKQAEAATLLADAMDREWKKTLSTTTEPTGTD